MKILVLACLLGYAAASFLQEAAPAVDDAILAFLKGTSEGRSLGEVLGSNDPMFDDIEDDIKTGLGKTLKQALDLLLKRIEKSLDDGKAVSDVILQKVKDIREKIEEMGLDYPKKSKELLEKIKEKAKELLKKLLKEIGMGKRNLDHEMDAVARMKFSDLVEKIREKILSNETIQEIREYIRKMPNENEVVKKLKEFVEKLSDVDLKEILKYLLELRSGHNTIAHGETWDKVKIFFKELNVNIHEHSKKFGEWVKEMWGKGIDKLRERHGAIKAIALEFIANAKDIHAEIARQALEFFRPYQDDLGTLWKQIVDATKEAIGRF